MAEWWTTYVCGDPDVAGKRVDQCRSYYIYYTLTNKDHQARSGRRLQQPTAIKRLENGGAKAFRDVGHPELLPQTS